jgi:hypothetical protein
MSALSLVRITPKFSFSDILDKQGLEPKVYQSIVETWMVKPVEALLVNYPPDSDFRGMAALSIALQFFEQHGEFLTGESSSNGKSKKFFCMAFDDVVNSLGVTEYPPSDKVYKWARCGLFHSARLSHELLIDAVGLSSSAFSRNPMIYDGWLVNPLMLVVGIRTCVSQYCNELEKEPNNKLAQNFNARFSAVMTEPLKYFAERLDYT